MQTKAVWPFSTSQEQACILQLLPIALSNVPFHNNTESVTRYFAEQFPVHLAVHEVSPVKAPPAEYTLPHLHDDADEINIIISRQQLLYKIQLHDEMYEVVSNSCIWIPRHTLHAANVLSGSGFFITLRIG